MADFSDMSWVLTSIQHASWYCNRGLSLFFNEVLQWNRIANNAGIVSYKFKDFDAAVEDLSACVKLDMDNMSAYTYLVSTDHMKLCWFYTWVIL